MVRITMIAQIHLSVRGLSQHFAPIFPTFMIRSISETATMRNYPRRKIVLFLSHTPHTHIYIQYVPCIVFSTEVLTFRAVFSGPLSPTDALLHLQIELSVAGAIRQTLPGFSIQALTRFAHPSFATNARPFHAETVTGAIRVRTVLCDCKNENVCTVDIG